MLWLSFLGVVGFASAADRPPVFFVPGLAGAQLLGSATNVKMPSCYSEPFSFQDTRMWINAEYFITNWMVECWANLLALQYDPATSQYLNLDGIHIEPDSPNSTKGMEYLGYIKGRPCFKNFHYIVEAFVADGFEREVTLFGFPWDWRYPPWQANLPQLKILIERVVRERGMKAVLIGHSMGSLLVTYFLNTEVDAAWKAAHVESFISINGANAGSSKAVAALLSGHVDTVTWSIFRYVDVTAVAPAVILDTSRRLPSINILLPHPKVYNPNAEIVRIMIPPRRWFHFFPRPFLRNPEVYEVYSLSNWTFLLPPDVRKRFESDALRLGDYGISDPGVPTYCLWGNIKSPPRTPVKFTYSNPEFSNPPELTMGQGDGTLPLIALKVCEKWPSTRLAVEFPEQEHSALIRNATFNQFVVSLVYPGGDRSVHQSKEPDPIPTQNDPSGIPRVFEQASVNKEEPAVQ